MTDVAPDNPLRGGGAKDRPCANFRRQMPIAQRWAYFDNAAVAPLSGPAQRALFDYAQQAATLGDTVWPQWEAHAEAARRRAAQLIGAEDSEIALVPNTTAGINLVAEGFPWQPGDRVVTLADEFPSNQYPWLNLADRQVDAVRVPTERGRLNLDHLADACNPRTRIVSVSWVSFSSGWRNDLDKLAEIAHGCGALLMVDAIQALGVQPLDVRRTPIDFLAADGHKWLLGPEGAGVFFIRKEHLDRLRPVGIGWNSVVHRYDFGQIELAIRPEAARYEGGSMNLAGFWALGESLALLLETGTLRIAEQIDEIGQYACERLERTGAVVFSERSPQHRSGIILFDLPGRDPQAVVQACRDRDVVLSARGGRLRISVHGYNDRSDVDRLIEALKTD